MAGDRPAGADRPAGDGDTPVVLGYARADRLVLLVGFPALGGLLGLALPPLARWSLRVPVLPIRFLFRLAASVAAPWEIAVCAGGGVVLGFGLALLAVTDSLRVTLTTDGIRLDERDRSWTVDRADVDAVFLDGRLLVVLDRHSCVVVRDVPQASREALAHGFRSHGYPWRDTDPYADLYRRWIPGTPDLPPAVDAVLAARAVALRKRSAGECRNLAGAVEKLGYAVREEGGRQYWRPLVRS